MISSGPSTSFRTRVDHLLSVAFFAAALGAGGLIALIIAFLTWEAAPALSEIGPLRLFTDRTWYPEEGSYGLAPTLLATLAITAGALAIAVPLGVATAVFGRFYAGTRSGALLRRLVELLAGIPSIVYGLWGLTVLVPLIATLHPPGASLLAASVVLGVMVLPIIALAADTALLRIDPRLLQSAAALGLDRFAIIRRVGLPAARSGLAAGLILGATRGLGETMAVLMVAGNVVRIPGDLFDPVRPLTAHLALEMSYATSGHRAVLFAGALILMGCVGLLIAIVDRFEAPRHRG